MTVSGAAGLGLPDPALSRLSTPASVQGLCPLPPRGSELRTPLSRLVGRAGVLGRGHRATALSPAAPQPRTATGTLSIEILEVNDHAPVLVLPPPGSLCSEPHQGPGLLLGATDEDLPPHGAPFHFQLNPRLPELGRNWSLSQVNGALPPPPRSPHRRAPRIPHSGLGPGARGRGACNPVVLQQGPPPPAASSCGAGLLIAPRGQMRVGGTQAQDLRIPHPVSARGGQAR